MKRAAFSIELLEWGRTISGFRRKENSGNLGFQTVGIFTTLSVKNVPIHFRMILLKGFIR